ncbi:dynamin family protein-like protein [Usnea florida]
MGSSNQPRDTVSQIPPPDAPQNVTEDLPRDGPSLQPLPAVAKEMDINSSLEDLQTDEQRQILDTVAQVRKCGLESILYLPQLVVCGDQSAGKSSVLEALTEIPFPRNDNLCTRFATEIVLRRANTNSLTIKIIPDSKRPANEQTPFKAFKESITNFDELPRIMSAAMGVMDIGDFASGSKSRAFARDVLSIEIEGPSRPQLTLVDIPGLIQTGTKGITKADVELVGEITDQYIKQPRTICLAVVSAASDPANQSILTKVREVDPDGDRTLGIITKPDTLPSGSGSEAAYIELAKNNDIFFKLGWHVLKNRKFEERDFDLVERNMAEAAYFRTSNFKVLPEHLVGVDTLRIRLSKLLFEHVKQELPKLRSDLEDALTAAIKQLDVMGDSRTTSAECKAYLTQLSLEYYEFCKAAVDGHYEGGYFNTDGDNSFSLKSAATVRRLRAVIQHMNTGFSNTMRNNGHKYQISASSGLDSGDDDLCIDPIDPASRMQGLGLFPNKLSPTMITKGEALEWVRQVLMRTRGRELVGNFNPLLVGELFWEQCSNWNRLAVHFLDDVDEVCNRFLAIVLADKCPKDIVSRLHASLIRDSLRARKDEALQELGRIIEDTRYYPINYNHYYTDTLYNRRRERNKASLASCIESATTNHVLKGCSSNEHTTASVNVEKAVDAYSKGNDPNMENVSCEEALDCLFAIYKVSQKTFVANVTTQVIERHMIRGLEKIFSPVIVNGLKDSEAEAIASEPTSSKRQRQFLEDRIAKLKDGQKIFRSVMGSAGT